jgi:phosphate:Na+ symporter
VHVVFNVVGVLVWLPLIWLLVDIAVWISPSSPELDILARAGAEVPRQIANANTFFNVINTMLFIGFAGWFARLAERLVPERKPRAGVIIEPEFLNEAALVAAPIALQQVRLELGRVGDIAVGMLQDIIPAFKKRDMQSINDIARRDDEIDILEDEILRYLGNIRKGTLSEQDSLNFQGLMIATDNFESLADVIETDLVSIARKAADLNLKASEKTRTLMMEVYDTVLKSVELTVQAIRDNDQHAAESVLLLKNIIRDNSESLLTRKANRLATDDQDYLKLVQLQMSFVDQMRRIYTLTKRIAKVVLPPVLAQ